MRLFSPGRPSVAGREERRRFWAAIAAGAASEDAAAGVGVLQAACPRSPFLSCPYRLQYTDTGRSIFTGRAGCNRCPESTPLLSPCHRRSDQARTSRIRPGTIRARLWNVHRQPPPSRCCDDHLNPFVLCVRWYLRYKLSFRDLVEMMAERGLSLAHTTIMRWIQRYVPEFEKRWNRFARLAGRSWRVDETY